LDFSKASYSPQSHDQNDLQFGNHWPRYRDSSTLTHRNGGKVEGGVSENRVLRQIFGPNRQQEERGNCIMMTFTACIFHHILQLSINFRD
jgi:hypothetical protein